MHKPDLVRINCLAILLVKACRDIAIACGSDEYKQTCDANLKQLRAMAKEY